MFFAFSHRHRGPIFVFGRSATERDLSLYVHDNMWHFKMYCWPSTCSEHTVSVNHYFRDSVWNYMALTFDAATDTLRLWRNGRLFSEHALSGTAAAHTSGGYLFIGLHIGTDEQKYTPKEYARLACLQIYDRQLRASQIQKLILRCQGKASMEGNLQKA